MARDTKVPAPSGKGSTDRDTQVWRAIEELQQKTTDTARRWAHFYMSADQTGIGVATQVLFDTVLKRSGELFAAPTGTIKVPPGYWRFTFGAYLTHSAASAANFAWYDTTSGQQLVGQIGQCIPATHASALSSGGLGASAIAYLHVPSGRGTVAVKCAGVTSGTVAITGAVAKALVEEVDPWE